MDQDSAPYISKKQKPNSELVPPNHAEYPCKFYNNFPFKTMLVVIFLAAVPLFPLDAAPEIISQTLNTGNWELVQLILVGIAVSYGLFSKKSDDDDDDEVENEYLYSSKFDNVQSRLLEVSSSFNEAENHDVYDENRVQTWNNYQYCSGKPVVVAKESASSRIVEKPLLLPIRSLKSPVIETISTNTTSPKSMISSPRKLSTSLSFSSESDQANCLGHFDHKVVRKQSFNKSCVSNPPPPPPLPPAAIVKKYTLLKSSSITTVDKGKELRRSTRSVPFELRDEKAYKGKSVRTIRPFVGAARARVYARVEEAPVDKQMQALEPTSMEFAGEEKEVVESDEESEDWLEESSENVEVASNKSVNNGGQDNVDKKADEFIAKFREQIRRQRIRSIRTSAGQPAKELLR